MLNAARRRDDAIHEAAALWFARESGGTLTPTQHDELAAWRRADPAHDAAYRTMQATWRATRAIPPSQLQAVLEPARVSRSRRRALGGLALAGAAGVAGLVIVDASGLLAVPTSTQTYATGIGERRQVRLADGSRIDLNTNTTLDIRLYARRREVTLGRGEAWFSVQADTARPFDVLAGPARVRVTGTQFNVLREGEQVRVGVSEGSVQVRMGGLFSRRTHALRAGDGLEIGAQGAAQASAVDVTTLQAWRDGKVVFDGTPLQEVIAQLNRYRHSPILLRDPVLAHQRIAGVFSVDDTDAFLNVLPRLIPVRIERAAGQSPRIVSR